MRFYCMYMYVYVGTYPTDVLVLNRIIVSPTLGLLFEVHEMSYTNVSLHPNPRLMAIVLSERLDFEVPDWCRCLIGQ